MATTEKKVTATTPAAPAAPEGKVSEADKAFLSSGQQAQIKDLSAKAQAAAAAGNPDPSFHQQAEAIRASAFGDKGGYSGGADGSQFILQYTGDGRSTRKASGGSGSGVSANAGSSMQGNLDKWLAAAQQQQSAAIQYATDKAVNELTRAEQDAQAQFQEQRNQIDIDEARAKDNQALYAEARGDKGGIGAAQYDSIMNTAAQNRLQVSQAQQKLSTDTARQIADLRAQGEFQKADALLQLTQTYLSQLISLEQWAAEYGLSVQQFNAQLDQWNKEFELAVSDVTGYYKGSPTLGYQTMQYEMDQNTLNRLSEQGMVLLNAGIPPSAAQLEAMGMTADQANTIIAQQKLAAAQKGNGSGGDPTTGDIYQTLYNLGYRDYNGAYGYLVSKGGYKSQREVAESLAGIFEEKVSNGDFNTWETALQNLGYDVDKLTIWNDTRTKDGVTYYYVPGFKENPWFTWDDIEFALNNRQMSAVPNAKNNTITITEAVTKR